MSPTEKVTAASATPLAGHPVSILHKDRLTALTAAMGGRLSEYCFANLYLFRSKHEYQFVDGPYPHVTGVTYDGVATVMPLFDILSVPEAILAERFQCPAVLFPIPSEVRDALPNATTRADFVADDSDYLYRAAALAALAGDTLRKKRNQISQLLRAAPDIVVRDFTAMDAILGKDVLAGWLSDVGRDVDVTDYRECLEALDLFGELDLFGLLCTLPDGRPLGFLLASEIWRDTCSVHFAKARRDPIGISAYLFSRFADSVKDQYAYINFEQDLGKVNFRAAKRAYDPYKILRKYRISAI